MEKQIIFTGEVAKLLGIKRAEVLNTLISHRESFGQIRLPEEYGEEGKFVERQSVFRDVPPRLTQNQ